MAEDAKTPTEAAGGGKKKKLVLGLIVLNLLTLGGFGAFVFLGPSAAPAEAAEATATEGKESAAKAETAKDGDDKAKDEKKTGDKAESTNDDAGDSPAVTASGDGDLGPTVMIGKFTINLTDRTTQRYLRVVISAEIDSEDTVEELKKRNAQLRHVAIAYLSSLRRVDTQGQSSMDEIRSALERRFNHVLTTGKVKQVYFTDFVTQ